MAADERRETLIWKNITKEEHISQHYYIEGGSHTEVASDMCLFVYNTFGSHASIA